MSDYNKYQRKDAKKRSLLRIFAPLLLCVEKFKGSRRHAALHQQPGVAAMNSNGEKLKEIMGREIDILRELLASMRLEQSAILKHETESMRAIMKEREPLVDTLFQYRNARNETLKQMQDSNCLEMTLNCELLSLRDQIAALLEKMQQQTERNNFLLENRVLLTKEMIRRLYPCDHHCTYSQTGVIGKKTHGTTVMVINREV